MEWCITSTMLVLLLHAWATSSSSSSSWKSNLVTKEGKPGGEHGVIRYFEVRKPIVVGSRNPCVVTLLWNHDFGNTYGDGAVTANYTPSVECPHHHTAWKIVLEWDARATGRQFDRIFGVWIGGVEILRSSTAEPLSSGILWTVQKDVTRYRSLLSRNNTLAVYLGNIVDETYTAVYQATLKLLFYPQEDPPPKAQAWGGYSRHHADVILPLSRDLSSRDGLWFEIGNWSDGHVKKDFTVVKNTYRAVVEIYVSFHENDEFWYTNLPQEYVVANNLSSALGNGPFREVVVAVDGRVVSALCPFTVIYTGGINPLLWRPLTAIASFDLPSYDVDLTPFLGSLLDGRPHSISLAVTNSLNIWYLGMNLHLWLDPEGKTTTGRLLLHRSPPPLISSAAIFQGLNGKFHTKAERRTVSAGWVRSSFGTITTRSTQSFRYTNSMDLSRDGLLQVVHQTTTTNRTVEASSRPDATPLYSLASTTRFPLRLSILDVDCGGGTSVSEADVELGLELEEWESGEARTVSTTLNTSQRGTGIMVVKGNLVSKGLAETQQVYEYSSSSSSSSRRSSSSSSSDSSGSSGISRECYFRNISTSNYTIIYDIEIPLCTEKW